MSYIQSMTGILDHVLGQQDTPSAAWHVFQNVGLHWKADHNLSKESQDGDMRVYLSVCLGEIYFMFAPVQNVELIEAIIVI